MHERLPAPSVPSRTIYKLLVLLMLVGAITYSNSFTTPFLLDDVYWISNNEQIKDLGAYLEVMHSRPVTALTLFLNYRVHGLGLFGYHLVNLAIHLGATFALFGVVRLTLLLPRWDRRFEESAHWLAFAIALLWMVHPLQTQAVTYIIQRGESLMGLFFLLALYALIRGTLSEHGWRWNLLSFGCFLVGAKSKEVMVTYLPVVLCYDLILIGSYRDMVRKRWWYYLAIAVYWAITLSGTFAAITEDSEQGSAGFGLRQLKPEVYMMTQAGMLLHYIRLVFIPYPQAFSYRGWPWVTEFDDFWPAGLAIALLAIITAGLMLRRHWVGFLGAWFFGILSITSIVPLIDPGFEHRMYLPLAAFCVFVVLSIYFIQHRMKNRRLATSCAFALLIIAASALAALTMRRNQDYRSTRSIWETVVEILPEDAEAWNNAAVGLTAEGKIDEALAAYEKALQVSPGLYLAEHGYGLLLCRQDRFDEGLPYLARSNARVEDNPLRSAQSAWSNLELGRAYWIQNDMKSAELHLRKSIKLAPTKDNAYSALASVLYANGRLDEARAVFAQARDINPRFAKEAARKAEQILHRQVGLTKWYRKEALFLAIQAAQASEYRDVFANVVLADAYFANRMYAEAIQATENAIRSLDPADTGSREIFQRNLLRYQQQRNQAIPAKGKS